MSILLSLVLLFVQAAAVWADVVPGEILVKYKAAASTAHAFAVGKAIGVRSRERLPGLGITRLHLDPGTDLASALKALRTDRDVVYAEPNYVRHPVFTPNDPDYASNQYGPQRINAPDAWGLTTGRSGAVIAVIDSGVDASHPDLRGHVLAGIDDAAYAFGQTPTGPWHDALGHGTHVAGIAAASINNGLGIAGIAGGDTILPVKVFPDSDNASDVEVAQAIRDAADSGAQVINLSLGGAGASQTLQDAINYAWSRDAVIVAAAGNDGTNEVFYPAGADHVVAVAATDQNDATAGYSNFGSFVALAAPGSNIYSTVPGGYAYLSGTSMATPFVSGVAGLAFAFAPNATNTQVVAALEAGADKVGPYAYGTSGRNDHYGFGRLNAYGALTALAQRTAVYRLYNSTTWDHFYTISAAEAAAASRSGAYKPEGVIGYAPTQANAQTAPLYRLYNSRTGEHFYTASATERDRVITVLGYRYEGVRMLVLKASGAGTAPLYRLYSPTRMRHFYTTNTRERDSAIANLGYRYEGIVGYLYTGL